MVRREILRQTELSHETRRPVFKLGHRAPQLRTLAGRLGQYPIVIGLRDRALIGAIVYSFARVGATATMRVGGLFSAPQALVTPGSRLP
jgi:hypothetical protein